MKNLNGKLLGGIVTAWFVFALIGSAFHLYETSPGQPPIPIGLGAGIPLIVFLVWFAASESFRNCALSLNPRVTTLVQSWRVVGFTMLVLYANHLLPGLFALPAGIGDMLVGFTAPFAALKLADPEHRSNFIRWQILGIIDLVTAVGLGTAIGFLQLQGISTAPMTMLPMSIIPTFGVPLYLILHIISIAQALRWKPIQARAAAQLQASIA